ncbi:MAG: hypothetical protein PT934_02155 [Peptoniphilaceae bacterium]|uniref:hypothetical protein n=1 Tax=Parvimonas sp. TaxID=1944660 RepID=UPI0025CE0F81|nr:hypothetical protein [Parvimonas sp.]MCI5997843.1 hypothetical protein [Parvimonas sp.]MDD7764552.1 hypothetical protein [Peptoniphilaceae bacterium]MDY3050530.1 hypothetical protein [Parvimonas sp.]
MSKNKYKGKGKVEKNPSDLNENGFNKSILSDYSYWRQDYSEEDLIEKELEKEKTDTDSSAENLAEINEVVNDVPFEEKENIDFKEHLINSQINDKTFLENQSEEELESVEITDNDKSEEENSEEEILTETQRLKLIYGNVVPLHERRRRGSKDKKNSKKQKNEKNKSSSKDRESKEAKKSQLDQISEIKEEIITKNKEKDVKESVENKKEKTETKQNSTLNSQNYTMTKIPKFLKWLFALSLVIAISIVGFFGVKAYHSLSIKFPNIMSSFENKSVGFYTTHIIFDGKYVNSEQAKSLIEAFNKDEFKLETVKKWLNDDFENLKKNENYISQRPIRLQKHGKVMGMFDDYKIFMDPCKFKVSGSDKVTTTVLIGDKEEKATDKEYTVFPGEYTIFYDDNGVKLKNMITVFPDEKNEVKTFQYGEDTEYELANEVVKVNEGNDSSFKIVTRDENSILFVNDKNTTLTVKEFNKLSSSSVKKDDVLKVVTKMPWGYTISKGVTYDGEKSINVSASLSDERLRNVAIAKTTKLLKDFMLARGNKDLSLLDGMTGSALEISKGYVETFINSGREYVGGYPSMEFDLNSFEVSEYQDTYKMYIGGHLLVQETSYGANDNVPKITDVTPLDEKVGFHFVFDKDRKDWLCNMWGFTTREITRDNIESVDLSRDMILK